MSLSSWYANIVLPGSNASEVTLGEGFSTEFDWENEQTVDKISYCLSLDVKNSTDNPLEGREKRVVMSGVKNFVTSNRKYDSLFNAVRVFESNSSSSCSSSSSSSSLSSSCSSCSCSSSCSSWVSSSSSSCSSSSRSSSSSSSSLSSHSSSSSSSSLSSSCSSLSSSSLSSSSYSSSSSRSSSSTDWSSSYVIVSGAGTPGVDGTYTYNGYGYGHPSWQGGSFGQTYLFYDPVPGYDPRWRLEHWTGQERYNNPNQSTPPTGSWQVGGTGTFPAPTVTFVV